MAARCPLCGGRTYQYDDTGDGGCASCHMVADELRLRVQPVLFNAGYHVGWRAWHTKPLGVAAVGRRRRDGARTELREGVLYSMNSTPWEPGQRMEAVCEGGGTAACSELAPDGCVTGAGQPDRGWCGTCGIYAARTFGQLGAYSVQRTVVLGAVALWGRVREHEYVWRGQYAYPLCFVETQLGPAGSQALAEVWGVPRMPLLLAVDLYAEAA